MNTSNGSMCGTDWDEYCHKLLALKYSYYQQVPSQFGGDLGIEGFVKTSGIVFQCYCPDGEPSSTELYENNVIKSPQILENYLVMRRN